MKALIQKILVVCLMVTGVAGNAWGADETWTTTTISSDRKVDGNLTIKPKDGKDVAVTIAPNVKLVVEGNLILDRYNDGWLIPDYYYGQLIVNGNLEVRGNIVINYGSNTFTNNGTLTATGNVTNGGTFTSNGTMTANSISNSDNFTNNGTLTAKGNVTNGGTLTSNGTMTANSITNNKNNSFTNKGPLTILGNLENNGTLTSSKDLKIPSSLTGSGTIDMTGATNPKLTVGSANSTITVKMGNNAQVSANSGDLKLGSVTVGANSSISTPGSLTTTGGTIGNNTSLSIGKNFTNGSTLTLAGEDNIVFAGNLINNGNMTIPNNLIVEGNITNNGTITMNGGVLRVGTKESDGKVKSGTGNLTLNEDSSLLFGNNGGKESLIEVGGNLIGDEEAYIKSSNGGKGKLAVVGTYYDYVDEQDVYHPDWGVSVDRLLLGTIIGLDFELKDNPNVFLSANRYELPDISGSLINDILDALGWTDTDGKIRDILNNKSINSGNLNEILQEISEALPIELVYFRAQQDDGNVEFTWQTASELNNDYFTIEYSLNAIDFEELAIVAGSGTTTETVDYQYAELSANYSGTVYYRLKQTDYDGNFTYSDMIALTFAEKKFDENISTYVVYPNPATDIINVKGQFEQIAVCDFNGRVLAVASQGENTLNVSNLPSGTYYVKVTTEGEQRLIPFVKR